jgi:hypothetical protein
VSAFLRQLLGFFIGGLGQKYDDLPLKTKNVSLLFGGPGWVPVLSNWYYKVITQIGVMA